MLGSIGGAEVALGAAAQSRCDGVGSESSRRKPFVGAQRPEVTCLDFIHQT